MDHAITVADVLRTFGGMIGVGVAVVGFMALLGGMMSDDPEEGGRTSRNGCLAMTVGIGFAVALGIGLL